MQEFPRTRGQVSRSPSLDVRVPTAWSSFDCSHTFYVLRRTSHSGFFNRPSFLERINGSSVICQNDWFVPTYLSSFKCKFLIIYSFFLFFPPGSIDV